MMKSRHLTLSLILLSIVFNTSCYVKPITAEGEAIRVVTKDQKECCCDFVDVISVSESVGMKQVESAMNKIRNKVAEKGGNAMFMLDVSGPSIGVGAHITTEALKCDFGKMDTNK